MIHVFQCLLKDEFDNDVEDGPVAVLMDSIDHICPSTHGKYPNCTFISMKSGASIMVRAPFDDVYSIWQTCTEPINLNQ